MITKKSKKLKSQSKIIFEEQVYSDVFPVVQMYQSYWLGAAILNIFLLFFPIFGDSFDYIHQDYDPWLLKAANIIINIVFVALFLLASNYINKLNKYIGFVFLWLGFLILLAFAFILAGGAFLIIQLFLEGDAAPGLLIAFLAYLWLVAFTTPLAYQWFRAGRRIVYAPEEAKQIVSEINTRFKNSTEWFSKALGMSIPIRYINKNKFSSILLFIISGIGFSSFTSFFILSGISIFFPFVILSSYGFDSLEGFTLAFGLDTDINLLLFSPLLFLWFAGVFLLIAVTFRSKARELVVTSIQETQVLDARPPVLFLRSFRDDQVKLPKPRLSLIGRLLNSLQRKASLDQLLLEEATIYGPLVALGNPDEPLSPFGASRGYFTHKDWKTGFSKLAVDSLFIIICLDETEGVLWEAQYILAQGYLPKTLFLLHPNKNVKSQNEKFLKNFIDTMMGESNQPPDNINWLSNYPESIIGFFFEKGQELKVGVSNDFSEASYLMMTRWFLRTTFNG